MGKGFNKIGAVTYEVVGSGGYCVQLMNDKTWSAYLPSAYDYWLWQSPKHASRQSAAMAISGERRRISREVREATQ